MKELTEQRVREIVRQEMNMNKYSGVPIIPYHTHDGNNSPRIEEKNEIHNNKYTVWISVSAGTAARNVLTISNAAGTYGIYNPTAVSFFGSGSSGSTLKAITSGNAQLGSTIQQSVASTSQTTPVNNVVQANTSMYFDSTSGAWIPSVHSDNINLGTIRDSTGNALGSLQVIAFTYQSLTIQFPLAGGWTVTGGLIIS